MRVAVSAMGGDLEAPFSPVFGRCPMYVLVDTDTMAFEAMPNLAASAAGGAGIQAAQSVINRGVNAIITGQVGPNAYQVLAAAGVPIYLFSGGTVRQAIEALKAGQLGTAAEATRPAHFGVQRGGFGFGGPAGRGRAGFGGPAWNPAPEPQPSAGGRARPADEVSALRSELRDLQERMERLANRINDIEETRESK